MVADCGSAETAERVRQAGKCSDGYEELFNLISLARQIQPVFVAQLPAGIDEESGGS